MEIEFIKDYKTCHKAGSRFDAQPHFAKMLIEDGYAKAVSGPPRNKMVERPEKKKGYYNFG
ncbi:MAG: hypothetical protein ISS41_12005 [Candidatus Aminicenantes bacterium]|nr:hypothetical protein [Candidatus Aminicenantes bacterium]